MGRSTEDRWIELEIQLAHLQRLYEQLNEVVTAQSLEYQRMRLQVGAIAGSNQAAERKARTGS